MKLEFAYWRNNGNKWMVYLIYGSPIECYPISQQFESRELARKWFEERILEDGIQIKMPEIINP